MLPSAFASEGLRRSQSLLWPTGQLGLEPEPLGGAEIREGEAPVLQAGGDREGWARQLPEWRPWPSQLVVGTSWVVMEGVSRPRTCWGSSLGKGTDAEGLALAQALSPGGLPPGRG